MNIDIRRANRNDYQFLKHLEHACFDSIQQSTNRAILTSLRSTFQSVYIATVTDVIKKADAGSLIVHLHKKTLRLYSIAVLPAFRNQMVGAELMEFCIDLAKTKGLEQISLEAMTSNAKLIAWYESFGFRTVSLLPGYYADGVDANRMILKF